MFEQELRKAVNDSQEFIRNNMFNDDLRPKRWFININYQRAFVKLHPEGGKIDDQHDVSARFHEYHETELRDLRTGKTFWYGLFNTFHEAIGFALIVAKVYKIQTDYKLRVTVCRDDMTCEPLDPF